MQLTARWTGPDTFTIDGVGEFTAHRVARTCDWWKPAGNTKTRNTIGIINCLANGCFRSYIGESACYDGGCYANCSVHAYTRKGFDVTKNTQPLFRFVLPKGDFSLPSKPRLWRVDSETADGSLSLSLGLPQLWAHANPHATIITICSNHFSVPRYRLGEAAALPNLVVGHSISAWHRSRDFKQRRDSIASFVAAGVRTMVWITTHPDWGAGNRSVLRAVERAGVVDPRQIIEVPYHRPGQHCWPVLHANPHGACCDGRVDRNGVRVPVGHPGLAFGKCAEGCRILCGYRWLKEANRESQRDRV